MIVQYVFNMQAFALNGEWKNALILSICFQGMKMSDYSVWAFERNVGFTDRLLLGSFTVSGREVFALEKYWISSCTWFWLKTWKTRIM